MNRSAAGRLVEVLDEAGCSVATAESLTGGAVVSSLVDIPGASRVVRGGMVVYATDLKISLLSVDADLVAAQGAVSADVAEQLAQAVRIRCRATYGLATTGVAGPGPVDGVAAGTVFIAIAGPEGVDHRRLQLAGGRSEVRDGTADAVLSWLADKVEARAGKNVSA